MRNASLFGIFISVVVMLGSCKPSADVVSEGWFQKRKYRNGFHVDIAKKKKYEDTYVLSAKTPKDSPLENESNVTVLERKAVEQSEIPIENNLSQTEIENSAFIVISSSHQANREIGIVSDEEEPNHHNKRRKNLKRIWGWLATALLLLVSLGILAFLFSESIIFLFLVGMLILPIPISLLVVYLIEHSQLKLGQSIFTEEKLERLRTYANRSIKLLAISGVAFVLIALLGIPVFIAFQLLLLWTILFFIIGMMFLVSYWFAAVLNVLSHSGNFVDTLKVLAIIISPLIVVVITAMLAFILGFLGALF